MIASTSKRNWLKLGLTALLSLAIAGTAMAANVHFKSDPVLTDLGETLSAYISLTGLGNKDVTITLAVTGEATVIYENPGGNQPPGQNKIPISSVTSTTVPKTLIKNGTLSVTLVTTAVEAPAAPNENWTVDIQDV